MKTCFLAQVDWQQPWLAGLRDIAAPIVQANDWRQALNAAAQQQDLCNHRNLPLRFVPQEHLPPGLAYESYISQTGCVPTRDNLHDFFNALIWLAYPRTKAELNARQAAAIETAGTARVRGSVRDAITIFDENAALLVTADERLANTLRNHQWHDLFMERRQDFGRDYQVLLFGHALLEKLANPYKAITAHTWWVCADARLFSACSAARQQHKVDMLLAAQLPGDLTTRSLMPLPILGLPGWWPGQDDAFYRDQKVFRPKKKSPA